MQSYLLTRTKHPQNIHNLGIVQPSYHPLMGEKGVRKTFNDVIFEGT